MKQILYNNDNLNEEEINNVVKRAKILIINSNDEILFAHSKNNYFFVGGRLEEGETFEEAIARETKEETGIKIQLNERTPFCTITYMNKDYPTKGINTKSVAQYYIVKCDTKPNLNKANLTEEEKYSNFKLEYIHKDKVLEKLNDCLKKCTNKNVVTDTISVLNEFLKIEGNNY